MDRYATAVHRTPTQDEQLACATAAWGLSCNDVKCELLFVTSNVPYRVNMKGRCIHETNIVAISSRSAIREALRAVLKALELRLYCDRTAYTVLVGELKHPWVDFEVLADAIAKNVAADAIVNHYLQQYDVMRLTDSSDDDMCVV
jgi:hypothetical protein